MRRLTLALAFVFAATIFGAQLSYADVLNMNFNERSVYELYSTGKFIKARKMTEELLKADPDSFVGTYVYAHVFHDGEGNLFRALQLYKDALKLFERAYCTDGPTPKNAELQSWHLLVLSDIARIYGELDHREQEVEMYDHIGKLYNFGPNIDMTWGLIKLGQYDRASAIIDHTLKSNDAFFRSTAYNNSLALEDARHHHKEAYNKGLRALEFAGNSSCVILTNHARSEMLFLDWEGAMGHINQAATVKKGDCPIPPLLGAVPLYVLSGAYQKAISTMQKVRQTTIEKRMLIQGEKRQRSELVGMFFEMGFADKAYPLMKTVIDAPDRKGYDSLSQQQVRLAHLIMFVAVATEKLKRIDETLSAVRHATPGVFLLDKAARKRSLELHKTRDEVQRALWSAKEQALKEALTAENLVALTVPFYVMESPLYNFAIADVLGLRTAQKIVNEERARLTDEESQAFEPVFALLESYIAWRDKDYDRALERAKFVETKLDHHFKLLKLQALVMTSDIAVQRGDTAKGYRGFAEVYSSYPAVFRRFDIRLPARVGAVDDDDASQSAARAALASSRFVESEDAPFVISALAKGELVELCLSTAQGARLACSSSDPNVYSMEGGDKIATASIVDNFLLTAFAPRVDLSQADIHSLDGSPLRIGAAEALDNLINPSRE